MPRWLKYLCSLIAALLVMVAAGLWAIGQWLGSDSARTQVQTALSVQLGVPVAMDTLSLAVWPVPSVEVVGLRVGTAPPLTVQRVQARPQWRALLGWGTARQLELTQLDVHSAQLPQKGIDALLQSIAKAQAVQNASPKTSADNAQSAAVIAIGVLAIPQRITLQQIQWLSGAGEALVLDAQIDLSAQRSSAQVMLRLGGGTAAGPVRWQHTAAPAGRKDGLWQLGGELQTSGVDLAALPGLRARLGGRLGAQTSFNASAAQAANLGATLQTRTQFSVSSAVVYGVDLAKAVRTLGLSRGGQTQLDTLSGKLGTRGSGGAMTLALTDLQAKSGVLSASGFVNVAQASSTGVRGLAGKVSVDLGGATIGQLVGVPLEIGGSTALPEVRPTSGALIGGAIGSVLLPGAGTAAGAKLGDKAANTLSGLKDKLLGK
jgi:hypothetical protein